MTDQSDAEVSSSSVCSQASSLSWAGDYVTRSSDHWSFPAAALAAPSHVNFEVCGQGNLSAPFPPYPVLQVNTCYSSLAPDSSWDNDRAMGEFAWQQGCEEAEEEEEYCEDYGPYEEQEADEVRRAGWGGEGTRGERRGEERGEERRGEERRREV
eukprot:731018-Hanusia_phi.AAC.1